MAAGDRNRAPATTPYGEAVEQAARGLSIWCDQVAELVQGDVDRAANGTYGVADLASAGLRLLRVNVSNLIGMANVASDNLALIRPEEAGRGVPERHREVAVVIALEAGQAGDFVLSTLKGLTSGQVVPTSRVTVDPSTFTAQPHAHDEEITIRVSTGGLAPDTYRGELSTVVDGKVIASRPLIVAIDELL